MVISISASPSAIHLVYTRLNCKIKLTILAIHFAYEERTELLKTVRFSDKMLFDSTIGLDTISFLAHLSQRLEWAIVIALRPSVRPSSVRPSVWRKLFTYSTSSPELLDEFWWNLVGMKYSWSLTSVVAFQPDPPRGGSRAGQKEVTGGPLLQETSSSDWKATATNQMHSNDLEACGKKCCYFWFHSEVKFLTRFWRLFGLRHFALF